MPNKNRSWEERGWVLGDQLLGGKQGHTFLARRHSDPSDAFDFVLKRLKRQDDPTLRRRIHIEAQSLIAIDFDGVARLHDTNAEEFADESVALFVVTERIHGTDLAHFQKVPVHLRLACQIVKRVLTTVALCHKIGVVHRDIKPCHVILRQNSFEDPVLIDFGLAFNDGDDNAESLTALDQGVGNRFIILPEQLHGVGKRDPRSDITQCLGLLFFLVTRQNPGQLLTPDGKKPQHSVNLASIANDATSDQLSRLQRIFDLGFDYNPDKRWQSAEGLISEIDLLADPTESLQHRAFSARLVDIVSRARENPEIDFQRRTSEFFDVFSRSCKDRATQVLRECQNLLSVDDSAPRESTHKKLKLQWNINSVQIESKPAQVVVQAIRDSDRINLVSNLLMMKWKGASGTQHSIELGERLGLQLLDPSLVQMAEEFLEETWLAALNAYLISPQD